ncbi:MAG: hypothetical protein ACYDEJ_11080 [Desulfitobacteriaceae bacterium]
MFKDDLKQRVEEIVEAINSRDSLLEEFDEQIFNALVEKIEILTPAHFVFELIFIVRLSSTINKILTIDIPNTSRYNMKYT